MFGLRVSQIVDALNEIDAQLHGAATKNPRLALKNASKFLGEYSSMKVDELVKVLSAQKPAPRKKKATAELRTSVVQRHLRALKAAGTNIADFESAMSALESDKQARMAELQAIGEAYAFKSTKYKAKADAYSHLRTRFDRLLKEKQRSSSAA